MTVFDVFVETPYTYLTIKRGTVKGNTVTSSRDLLGIFKKRVSDGKLAQMEFEKSASTLHVHPADFTETPIKLGDGIRVDGTDYEIKKITNGTNFATGELEHITLTLEVASYV